MPSIIRSFAAAMDVLEASHGEAHDLKEWASRTAEAGNKLLDLPILTLSIVERHADRYKELVRAGSGVGGHERLEDLPLPVVDCLFRLRQVARPIDLVRQMPEAFQVHWRGFFKAIDCYGGGGVMGYVGRVSFALFGFMPKLNVISTRERNLLRQVAAHIETGLALRLGQAAEVAVLRPDGRLEHAEGDARDEHFRTALTSYVREVESVRKRRGRGKPSALDPWTALVEGRWGLVERVERDGQRFYVIVEREPDSSRLLALSPRETQVLELSARGASGRNVAYALGVTPAAVSKTLQSAALKMGCPGRTELVRATSLLLGSKRDATVEAELTKAEREVLTLVRGGFTNAEIGAQRGTSEHTVSNQLTALLRKAQVPSRRSLAAWQGGSGSRRR